MTVTVSGLSKSYDGRPVLNQVSLTMNSGNIYCLMGPSGSGKTTFFRLLLGLEQPDSGVICGLEHSRLSAVFQEDRLCEEFTPLENAAMVLPGRLPQLRSVILAELSELLPVEALSRPVSTLSGGMKRRTAICRALLPESDVVFMDEPFTGLDEATKKNVISYIRRKAQGRLIVISTHQEEDVALLGAELIHLT